MESELEELKKEEKSLDYKKLEPEEIDGDCRDEKLIELNKQLIEEKTELVEHLEIAAKQLDPRKREDEETEIKRQARRDRKRLLKREPMTKEIYDELIKYAEGPGYLKIRVRLAFCILAVTGIRISELLPLKVNHIKTLAIKHWITIDRIKKGPSNHKAFLTSEGKKMIKARSKDFEFMFLIKPPDSFIFTSELNHDKMLSRENLTKDVNKIMRIVSKQLPGKPNITSQSFRIGYITDLWRDSKDIEFVRQTIGHRKFETTSTYMNKLANQEPQDSRENFNVV